VDNPVLQFLEKLSLKEHSYQVFVIEEKGEKEKRVMPDMAHLRVVLAMINSVREEKVLLNNGLQIVSMTKKVAAANKVSWDPSLSIQMQSMNGSLSIIYRLARNCHDLAKWLSHYLYFFSFLFLLSWTYYTKRSTGKCHIVTVT